MEDWLLVHGAGFAHNQRGGHELQSPSQWAHSPSGVGASPKVVPPSQGSRTPTDLWEAK